MPRFIRLWLVAALAPGLIGCGAAETGPPDARPDILLVVLDTLRQDRTSVFGYARPTTPALEGLAAQGVRYPRAWSTTTWTPPAHASLFTGLYPAAHGVTQESWSLAGSHVTLAEHLGAAGYETVGVVGNPMLAAARGFAQGFATWEETWRDAPEGRPTVDEISAARIEQRLASRDDRRPLFLFVNLIGVHSPFDSCGDFCGAYGEEVAGGIVDSLWKPVYLGRRTLTPAELARLSDLYDAEVRQVDAMLARILVAFDAASDHSLVVVTSDHGENLGERGHVNHVFSLYETTTRVPLVVRGIGDPGTEDSRPVQLVDVFATLLAQAGVEVPPCSGRSLAEPLAAPRPVVTEYYRPLQAMRGLLEKATPAEKPAVARYDRLLRSWREGGWKLLWASDGRHELYHVSDDPHEQRDLSAAEPQRVARMARELGEWVQAVSSPVQADGAPAPLDAATRKGLEALGYVE